VWLEVLGEVEKLSLTVWCTSAGAEEKRKEELQERFEDLCRVIRKVQGVGVAAGSSLLFLLQL
jgi:peptide deformylase